ncbi:hypothetical protein [Primorskyibacter sp. 2E107]|uniref:hypothetical protein n=1 Tax=Primorskyibacter sp. 2E107 TaxID=3403458 RepID=UPI003AF862A2
MQYLKPNLRVGGKTVNGITDVHTDVLHRDLLDSVKARFVGTRAHRAGVGRSFGDKSDWLAPTALE